MPPLVIYHANCFDGFCAAWIIRHAFPTAEFFPAHYGTEPPDVTGRDVYIVDFSYNRPVMEKIRKAAASVTVLDHHKSAKDELASFGETKPNVRVVFDMDKSGGRLAWEWLWDKQFLGSCGVYLSGDKSTRDEPPWLVTYTEDRDLWRWNLEDSRAINAYIRSWPLEFETWDEWSKVSYTSSEWYNQIEQGAAILRREQQIVDEHVGRAAEITMNGYKILAVNATVFFSEIAGALAEGMPFGACYFDRVNDDGKSTRQWELRSRDGGVDVSGIAKLHGGGGHRNAAGFEELGRAGPTVPRRKDEQ